jgi:hypothetical protein
MLARGCDDYIARLQNFEAMDEGEVIGWPTVAGHGNAAKAPLLGDCGFDSVIERTAAAECIDDKAGWRAMKRCHQRGVRSVNRFKPNAWYFVDHCLCCR